MSIDGQSMDVPVSTDTYPPCLGPCTLGHALWSRQCSTAGESRTAARQVPNGPSWPTSKSASGKTLVVTSHRSAMIPHGRT